MAFPQNPMRPEQATAPSQVPVDTSNLEPSTSPLALAMAMASIAFLLAGFAWPHVADPLLRLLLATLAVGFVAARAYRTVQPALIVEDRNSPFGGPPVVRIPIAAPHALRKLTTELKAAADARAAERARIPGSVHLTVREEMTRRLAERHGLSVRNLIHHPDIQRLVSEPTWLLIRPRDPQAQRDTRPAARSQAVALSQLGRILDDLERL